MDFAYLSTSTPDEWATWAGRNVTVREDGLAVATEPTIEYHDLGFDALDVAVDRDGTVYALRPSGDVYRYDQRADRAASVWANGDGETVEAPRSLCLAGDRIFVADASGGLVAVSERESRSIGRIDADVDDLVEIVAGNRQIYVLDGGPPGGDGRVATLRRRGTVRTAISGLADPRDLTVDPDGNVAVLEGTADGPRISVYEARYVASPNAFPYRRTIEDFPEDPEGGSLVPDCLEALTAQEIIVHGPLSTSGEPATYHYRFADEEGPTGDGNGRAGDGDDRAGDGRSGGGRAGDGRSGGGRAGDGSGGSGNGSGGSGDGSDTIDEGRGDATATSGWRHAGTAAGGGSFERRHGLDVRCSQLRAGPQRGSGRYPTYYGVAADGNRVYAIEETKQYRRNEHTDRFTATAFRRFDAGAIDTQWHRVTLAFESLASNTQVLVSYHATDANRESDAGVAALDDVNEHDAADLRAAGIDSVWDLVEADAETISSVVDGATVERATAWRDAAVAVLADDRADRWRRVDVASPEDALLADATGRYLHVKLELVGDADTAPTVESFRAYCPRQSYMRYLPELFREDDASAAFLEQFLSVFESAYVDVEEDIETVTRYFDPAGVPSEYLSWLDQWLALDAHPDWPESARRELLDRAPELFPRRGTRAGLRAYLSLYLDHVAAPDTGWIVEWQRQRIEARRADGSLSDEAAAERHAAVDALVTADGGGHHLFVMERQDLDGVDSQAAREPYTIHMPGPRSFAVYVGPFVDPAHRDVVADVVATEKPAHADGHVVEMRQHVKLEGNSFLGINTTLTPRNFVLGRATLGEDSVLKEQEFL